MSGAPGWNCAREVVGRVMWVYETAAQRPTPAYGGAEQVWAAVAEMIADALGVAAIISATCRFYTSPSPRDGLLHRMPPSA